MFNSILFLTCYGKQLNALIPDCSRSIGHLYITVWTVYYWLIHDSKKKITRYYPIYCHRNNYFKELLSVKTCNLQQLFMIRLTM